MTKQKQIQFFLLIFIKLCAEAQMTDSSEPSDDMTSDICRAASLLWKASSWEPELYWDEFIILCCQNVVEMIYILYTVYILNYAGDSLLLKYVFLQFNNHNAVLFGVC